MKRHRNRATLLIACLTLALAGCFEEPIRQHLHLHGADGAVVVTWTDEVAPPSRSRGNAEVARRMREHRRDLEQGLTDASRWFGSLRSAADRFEIERHDGEVRRARWSAVVTDRRELEDLLSSIGLTATVAAGAGRTELYLAPGATSPATRAERRQLDAWIENWSGDVAEYLAATHRFYTYLETAPERAEACFVNLFGDDDDATAWPVSDQEAELLEGVANSIDDVVAVLFDLDDQPYSANELSRLVFDCFPYRLTVSAEGDLGGGPGWIETTGGLERPPVSLWQALEDLEGRWLEPDLASAVVTPGPEDAQPAPDPAEFAARPRWSGPPPAAFEVADVLRASLQNAADLTVSWSGRPPGSADLECPSCLLGDQGSED
jgi:hypothetical protein